jgi:hypothetical protein
VTSYRCRYLGLSVLARMVSRNSRPTKGTAASPITGESQRHSSALSGCPSVVYQYATPMGGLHASLPHAVRYPWGMAPVITAQRLSQRRRQPRFSPIVCLGPGPSRLRVRFSCGASPLHCGTELRTASPIRIRESAISRVRRAPRPERFARTSLTSKRTVIGLGQIPPMHPFVPVGGNDSME